MWAPSAHWRRRLSAESGPGAVAQDPLRRDEDCARLEAALFVAREPLTTRKLAQLAHLADGTQARTLIRRLNQWYDAGGSAFRAEEVAGGFQLLTRPRFGSWMRRLSGGPGQVRLSAPALETLAVVAYRQPVIRTEIEAIRGVDCGEILRQLMDRDLLRDRGSSKRSGPDLTCMRRRADSLQVFGLRHLDDLPRAQALRALPAQLSVASTHETSQSRSSEMPNDSLTETVASENEEDNQRDHHRPV